MFNRLLGFRKINKKIEKKLIQLSFIPSKYFEALYVECRTKIYCHTLDICEVEEKNLRGELLELMKKGEVDTKIDVEKFQLFERVNEVTTRMKEIRVLMLQYADEIPEIYYKELVQILKDVSTAGRIMFQTIRDLYNDYDQAISEVQDLTKHCTKIVKDISHFKFHDEKEMEEWNPEVSREKIGTTIRGILQSMVNVGEKVLHIIRTFSFNHRDLEIAEND